MRIKTNGINKTETGGGSTFLRNLQKALKEFGDELVETGEDYDAYLVAGASLSDRSEVEEAKRKGKPIVLRVDNILEDSRNRNTGMRKMREFAQLADVIVFQSEWAKRLLKPYCGDGIVIYNGVDTDVFYPRKTEKTWDNLRILYTKNSRNEVKRFHEVQYWWREYCLDKDDDTLVLVGNFAREMQQIDHPFEFHNDESFEYKGLVSHEKLADIMRECDLAFLPYYADACSNTVLEAQACGLPVLYCDYGGTKEIIHMGQKIDYIHSPVDMAKFARGKKKEYQKEDFEAIFGLSEMGKKYHSLFNLLNAGTHEL